MQVNNDPQCYPVRFEGDWYDCPYEFGMAWQLLERFNKPRTHETFYILHDMNRARDYEATDIVRLSGNPEFMAIRNGPCRNA